MEFFKKTIATILGYLILSTPFFYIFIASDFGYLSWETLFETFKIAVPFSILMGLLIPYIRKRYGNNEEQYTKAVDRIKKQE